MNARGNLARAAVVLMVAGLVPLSATATAISPGALQGPVVASIPVSADGVTYLGGGDEMQQWGPAALTADLDGTLWIADTGASRLLHYSTDGTRLGVIDLTGRTVGVTQIVAAPRGLALLDVAADPVQVLVVDRRGGDTVAQMALPTGMGLAHGLRRIGVDSLGRLFADIGENSVDISDAGAKPAHGRPVAGGLFDVTRPQARGTDHATVTFNQIAIDIKVNEILAGVYYLGEAGGRLFVVVDEVASDVRGVAHVDRTVRAFGANGDPAGVVRVPINDGLYVANGLTLTRTGDILALVLRPDRADVMKLALVDTLPAILPHEAVAPANAVPAAVTACRSRASMISTTDSYINNTTWLSDVNIDAGLTRCPNRIKPRYLAYAAYWPSVSYEFGGWNTPAQWNANMAAGKQAGNIRNDSYLACAEGIDCSGLVSRAWGLTSKHSTSGLMDISQAVLLANMQPGDIFDIAGSHTFMFNASVGGGYDIYESGVANMLDRVTHRWVDAGYINGYQTRKYNNVCP